MGLGNTVFALWVSVIVMWIAFGLQRHTTNELALLTSAILYPFTIPFYVLLALMIITVDTTYFPTGGVIIAYVGLMLYFGHFPRPDLATCIAGFFAWIFCGALWMFAKWWSFLRDPKNKATVANIPDGQERAFFISRIHYLYPHFLYWPISIPHTLITRLVYQVFEWISSRFGNTFAHMVVTRKQELK